MTLVQEWIAEQVSGNKKLLRLLPAILSASDIQLIFTSVLSLLNFIHVQSNVSARQKAEASWLLLYLVREGNPSSRNPLRSSDFGGISKNCCRVRVASRSELRGEAAIWGHLLHGKKTPCHKEWDRLQQPIGPCCEQRGRISNCAGLERNWETYQFSHGRWTGKETDGYSERQEKSSNQPWLWKTLISILAARNI